MGIGDGDTTLVKTKRGTLKIKAACKDGVLPGVIHIPHGWDEANCNLLTDSEARDPISGFPPLKSSLCSVEKV
jgi:anaerobic selenocysteine-containing dehydrogenase